MVKASRMGFFGVGNDGLRPNPDSKRNPRHPGLRRGDVIKKCMAMCSINGIRNKERKSGLRPKMTVQASKKGLIKKEGGQALKKENG